MATGGRAWGGDRARAGAAGAGGGCGGAMAERGPAFCGLYDTSSLLLYCNGESPLLSSDLGPTQGWTYLLLPRPLFFQVLISSRGGDCSLLPINRTLTPEQGPPSPKRGPCSPHPSIHLL